MCMQQISLKEKARKLRQKGQTYTEIKNSLKIHIPKNTLAYWCRDVVLPKNYHARIKKLNQLNLARGREISSKNRKEKREAFFKNVDLKNGDLLDFFLKDNFSRMTALVILYLAEGSKTARGSLMFGNSDPAIVSMFVNLLRECYKLDERKFRCTVQCRADQDIEELERFWSKTTMIPFEQFYKARIDKRTLGQITKKEDYKGVCRIDYFSSEIDLEMKRIARMFLKEFN